MLKLHKNKIFEKRICLSEDELLRYASNKMSEREKHHLEKHITDCELCNDALEGILLMKDSSLVTKYKTEILNSLANKKGMEKRIQVKYYWLAAAAVFAIVLLSGIYFQFIGSEGKLTNNLAVISEDKLKETSPPEQLIQQRAEAANQNNMISEKKLSKADEMISSSNNERQILKSSEGVTTTAKVDSKLKDSQLTVADNAAADRSITSEEVKENNVAFSDTIEDEFGNKVQETMATMPVADEIKNTGNVPASAESLQKMNMSSMEKKSALKTQESNLNDIYSDIGNKKYEEALNKLNVFQKSYPGNLRAIYYLGLVYYFLNEPAKAIDNFDIVMNVHEDSLFEDARWYKALALIKMKDNKNARIVLSKIIGEKGPYRKQAEKMLEQIDGN